MIDDKKADDLADDDLDRAQGGYSVELVNATVSSIRTEAGVIEYQDGTDLSLRKRPGRSK